MSQELLNELHASMTAIAGLLIDKGIIDFEEFKKAKLAAMAALDQVREKQLREFFAEHPGMEFLHRMMSDSLNSVPDPKPPAQTPA